MLDFVSIPSAREQTPSIPTVGLGRGRSYCEARLWGSPPWLSASLYFGTEPILSLPSPVRTWWP